METYKGFSIYPAPTFIAKANSQHLFYIPTGPSSRGTPYIHSDGVVRHSTEHEGKYTGYFPSLDEAKKAIDLYLNRLSA